MKRTAKFLSNMKQSTIAGLVLIPLGAWVALSPFLVGSWDGEFHFSRFVLAVLPGAAAAVGGLVMLGGRRALVVWGGALAMAAGAWLMVGPAAYGVLGSNELGNGPGGESIRMLQWVGFFFGAGALVSLLSSFAVGFPRPLEFSKEEWAAIGQPAAEPATAGRARVPQPQERPRRQRRTKEPAKQGRARSKSSRRTKS